MSDVGVSIVIPCFNPEEFLFEAVASARAQKDADVEVIVVDDGSNRPESLAILDRVRPLVDLLIRQPNRGVSAARNAGCAAGKHEFLAPLDCDDRLDPRFVTECRRELLRHPEASWAYSDVIFFGDENRIAPTREYNFHVLLDSDFLFNTILIPKSDFEGVGGYAESIFLGYEDWEFFIRLGGAGRFGVRVPMPLYHYRKHGPSRYTAAFAQHEVSFRQVHELNASLYADEARARIKARWSPAVEILGGKCLGQTLFDCADRPGRPAAAILEPGAGPLDSNSGELAALSVWAGNGPVTLPDGSRAYPRPPLESERPRNRSIRRHLENAGVLSTDAWLRHPVRSAIRLIPLAIKRKINEAFNRHIFDLTFYRRFWPSPGPGLSATDPLVYFPVPASRTRIAAILTDPREQAANGLEQRLQTFDRSQYELLLIVTSPAPPGSRERWRKYVDLIYDLEALIPSALMDAAVETILRNWRIETVIRGDDTGAESA